MGAKPSGNEPGSTYMMPTIFGAPQGEEPALSPALRTAA